MSPTTRRVMLWSGLLLVLGLGLPLAFLGYCNHRAVNRLDVLGVDRIEKPTGLPLPPPDSTEPVAESPPVEYEYFDKLGVSDVHRVGSQVYNIVKVPVIAMILVGVLLSTRALSSQRPRAASEPTEPIDPLAD